ncbi:MAG: hypothetical protein EXS18_07620 [Verrucomicrobiae bacterium]|nr:hypothetical protein [Verrucomicrobiae bacterium]
MSDILALIEKAFDYRGDVTIDLKDGSDVVGFVSNRYATGSKTNPEPRIELMVEGRDDKLVIEYADIQDIRFTGEDTAAGKSWADYQAKQAAKKASEAKK